MWALVISEMASISKLYISRVFQYFAVISLTSVVKKKLTLFLYTQKHFKIEEYLFWKEGHFSFLQTEKSSLTTPWLYKRESVKIEVSKWEGLLDLGSFNGVKSEWGLVSPSDLPDFPNHKASLLVPCHSPPPALEGDWGLGQQPSSPAPVFQVPSWLSIWRLSQKPVISWLPE